MESKLDNIGKITLKIDALKEYIQVLKQLKDTSPDELKNDFVKRGAVERYLQLAIESCIDISELIIIDQRLKRPDTSKEAILILGKEGIIDKKFGENFSKAVGFRNILVHDYVDVDYGKLYAYLINNMADFERFIKEILKFINGK